MPRKIASNWLWTPEGFLRRPLVTLDDGGRILDVRTCDDPDREPFTEFHAGLLTPGFVNAHCHLELSALRGRIPEGCGFAGFARAMGEVRGLADEEERRAAIAAADAEMTRGGIVAVGDIANGEAAFDVKSAGRIAYRTFAEFFGLRTMAADSLRPLLRHPRTSLTPHSVYSVQDAPFRALCAEGTAPLSIHFMESPAEAELFAGRGPLHEWYARAGFACDFLHYGSPAERLVRSIPAERPLILVHACCVGEEEVRRILAHFTAPVYWCLCPRSNRYISRLAPPVALLRSLGARICLGTDSLASNRSLSLLDELRALGGVPLRESLRWATLGGAEALGLDDALGTVAPGKRPGLNLLTGLDFERMALTPDTRVKPLI
ncbi:amidohydrolase family protein [uncultured Alistipes sp.]|uniref:amidohydrolase family protein n=1 Tax=uncultured Alistipes sp. TaxID=538949 RepID=UPI0026350072|nr:amidohydrolase family protein [uncultured Alistipes sp.]